VGQQSPAEQSTGLFFDTQFEQSFRDVCQLDLLDLQQLTRSAPG
jgi:hypothetical protein